VAKYTRFDPRNKKKGKNKISVDGAQSRTRFRTRSIEDVDDWGADIKKVSPARLQQIIESNG